MQDTSENSLLPARAGPRLKAEYLHCEYLQRLSEVRRFKKYEHRRLESRLGDTPTRWTVETHWQRYAPRLNPHLDADGKVFSVEAHLSINPPRRHPDGQTLRLRIGESRALSQVKGYVLFGGFSVWGLGFAPRRKGLDSQYLAVGGHSHTHSLSDFEYHHRVRQYHHLCEGFPTFPCTIQIWELSDHMDKAPELHSWICHDYGDVVSLEWYLNGAKCQKHGSSDVIGILGACFRDGVVRAWTISQLHTGFIKPESALVELSHPDSPITCFSWGDTKLVAGTANGTVIIWNLDDLEEDPRGLEPIFSGSIVYGYIRGVAFWHQQDTFDLKVDTSKVTPNDGPGCLVFVAAALGELMAFDPWIPRDLAQVSRTRNYQPIPGITPGSPYALFSDADSFLRGMFIGEVGRGRLVTTMFYGNALWTLAPAKTVPLVGCTTAMGEAWLVDPTNIPTTVRRGFTPDSIVYNLCSVSDFRDEGPYDAGEDCESILAEDEGVMSGTENRTGVDQDGSPQWRKRYWTLKNDDGVHLQYAQRPKQAVPDFVTDSHKALHTIAILDHSTAITDDGASPRVWIATAGTAGLVYVEKFPVDVVAPWNYAKPPFYDFYGQRADSWLPSTKLGKPSRKPED